VWGDEIERISKINALTGETIAVLERAGIYPAKHFITNRPTLERAVGAIRASWRNDCSCSATREAARGAASRVAHELRHRDDAGDRHLRGHRELLAALVRQEEGERPACLLDYYPADFLVIVDESHVSLPQIRGMYNGDRARKEVLVEYGFRLPSALDNRPLIFDEFISLVPKAMFVSRDAGGHGAPDVRGRGRRADHPPDGTDRPEIEVRPVRGQVDDLLNEIRIRERRGERVLVTTLTKRMAEDLTDYLQQMGVAFDTCTRTSTQRADGSHYRFH
jgi:excinuclease ABC subunit B